MRCFSTHCTCLYPCGGACACVLWLPRLGGLCAQYPDHARFMPARSVPSPSCSSALEKNDNVQTFRTHFENNQVGVITRQYVFTNLYGTLGCIRHGPIVNTESAYLSRTHPHPHTHAHAHTRTPDRLSTRPLLNSDEKRWIIFQLLKAVAGCHTNNVCHGDIKLDNVLLTSWNWVFLTDFASFKPTRIPVDNPAAFSFFFDTSGRQGEYPFWSFFFTIDVHPHHHYFCSHESFLSACSFGSAACYIAPERFYIPDNTEGTDAHICRFDGQLLPAMDIFSLGCVIYELVTDGKVRTHACTRHPPTVHTNLSCPLLF